MTIGCRKSSPLVYCLRPPFSESSAVNLTASLPDPLEGLLGRVRVTLVSPTHPGNVGGSLRAMATMGLVHCQVADPVAVDMHLDPQAVAMAAGADAVMQPVVYAPFDELQSDVRWSMALTARPREFEPPRVTLDEGIEEMLAWLAAHPTESASLVFGPERSGLSNAHVLKCQRVCSLDVSPRFGSLNLSQAVQVVAHAVRRAARAQINVPLVPPTTPGAGRPTAIAASQGAVEGLHAHLMSVAERVGTLSPTAPGRMDERLRRLFARAGLLEDEVQMLRGLCSDLEKNL